MGYRSTLVLVVSREGELELQYELNNKKWFEIANENHEIKFNPEVQNNVKAELNTVIIKENENGDKLYVWEWIKWYPEDDIEDRILNNIIHHLSSKNYLFICIGEDVTDTELDGNYYDNQFGIGFERRIYSNKGDIENLLKED